MSIKRGLKFSIFLPVNNGGEYLPLCVESILAQSYQDYNLVILENQSTDGTSEWLRALERKDPKVKVITSKAALSIEDNWKRILTVPKNEFMTVIGHDDLLEPNFLEETNKTIQEEPDANLYLTHYKLIDSRGKLIRYCKPIPKQESAAEFLAARMAEIRDSVGAGSVMRSRQYDDVGGIPAYPNLMFADDALWVKLIGTTFIATSPQVCFSYRFHPDSVSGTPSQAALFAGLKQYFGFLRELAMGNADMSRVIKLYGPKYVAKWCQNYYYHLVKVAPWGRQVDRERLMEIERFMKEFASETVLDTSSTKFQLILWHWIVNLGHRLLPSVGKNALSKR
jgi:glycosyltransferase involved in cell wall biosynthesis